MTGNLHKLALICEIGEFDQPEVWSGQILKHLEKLNNKIEELDFKRNKYLPMIDRELDILDELSTKNVEKFAENKKGLSADQLKQVDILLKIRLLIQEKPVKIIREIVDARSPTTLSNEEILNELSAKRESDDASH